MRFALFDHQGKGLHIGQALVAAGWDLSGDPADCDLLLVDHDGPYAHPRPAIIEAAYDAGAKIVLYPHGALPTVTFYDGAYAPDARIDARLEHGEGHVEIGRRIGLGDIGQTVVGWTYSDRAAFAPTRPERILFAPIQPNGSGELKEHDRLRNHHAWMQLREIGNVAVRNPGFPADVTSAFADVDQADVVVAAGTLACLALARGKPVVMIHDRNLENEVEPAHLDAYDDYQRYPLTVGDAPLGDLIAEACQGSAHVDAWRNLFVGAPMIDISALLARIVEGDEWQPQTFLSSPVSSSGRATP